MTAQLPRSGQQKIPLKDWKRFIAVADWWDRTYGHLASPLRSVSDREPDLVRVRNPSGAETWNKYDVLELTEVAIPPADNLPDWEEKLPLFEASTPTGGTQKIGILAEQAREEDGFVIAVVAGAVRTIIDIEDENHEYAKAEAGSRRLKSTGDESAPCLILWKETGTGEKYAIVRIDRGGGLIRFKLRERIDTVDATPNLVTSDPKQAIEIDVDGTEVGEEFEVYVDPVLEGIYGPAAEGFKGWAIHKIKNGEDHYEIVNMQRFALFIVGLASFTLDCTAPATVLEYWHGENPNAEGWQVKARVVVGDCGCVGPAEKFVAVLDEKASNYPYLIYNVVELDQSLKVSQGIACSEECSEGTTTRSLTFADGLTTYAISCDAGPCAILVKADGLSVTQMKCYDQENEDPVESTSTGVRELQVEKPLQAITTGDCPAVATISLPEDFLVAGDCISIDWEDCKATISMDADCIPDPPDPPVVAAGTCISVDFDAETNTYTVNNTMQLAEGDGISIEGDACDKTITNAHTFSPGNCISIWKVGNNHSISNTMNLTAGPGIKITGDACRKTISVIDETDDERTTFSVLCDVDVEITCVEGSGGWTLQSTVTKSYTSFSLPTALVGDVSDDCSGGGTGGVDPPPPPPPEGCDDCAACGAGQIRIYSAALEECACLGMSESFPDGDWIACDPVSDPTPAVIDTAIPFCNEPTTDVIWVNIVSMPPSAVTFGVTITGPGCSVVSTGGVASVGPHFQAVPHGMTGCEGGLVPGETYTVSVQFFDADGNLIGNSNELEFTCPSP